MAEDHESEMPQVTTLIAGLEADSDSARKYAVFQLQGLLADPDFAEPFLENGGLPLLRHCLLSTTGNTLAYTLGSLDALLELDIGWEAVDGVVVEKAVKLAVTHPLVNIVRNALKLLVLVVSRPLAGTKSNSNAGFRALKPALEAFPMFLESLVQRLSASDHSLCANALQLVNALMRDAIAHGGETEWPKFIKRLQDLGVIGSVGMLMRGEAAADTSSTLSGAILEFQGLTKVLLRKWKGVKVNTEIAEHKRALKSIHLLSKPEKYAPAEEIANGDGITRKSIRAKHHPEKWRRLGFETESPAWEFEDSGYLGMMDLVDYARRNEDAYQKLFLEQSVQPPEQRCPLARASLGVTLVLYEHFEIEETADLEAPSHARNTSGDRFDPRANPDKLYRPLLLQWGRLHTASLNAFLRLWKLSGAETDDFYKIEELIRIIVERVIGAAGRKTDVATVEEELRSVSLESARAWQMEGLDEVYEDAWGPHLVQVREQLYHESLQFMKEQRIRCLLQGSWFPNPTSGRMAEAWRFARLSHNRRFLHYNDYATKTSTDPELAELPSRLDLDTVTSVDSNVSATDPVMSGTLSTKSSTETLLAAAKNGSSRNTPHTSQKPAAHATTTKLTILGSSPASNNPETTLLELYPQSPHLASEWLDGLLLLLNQQPITKSTTQLIDMMTEWGVRLRMLNLRWEDVNWEELERRVKGVDVEERKVPDREGVDDEFWYEVGGD